MNNQVFSSWHVGIAAEAFAAGLFARCGLDVSIQYGADQPEYDLIIARGERMLKVSVKGSKDGAWGLAQSYLTKGKADYSAAVDAWLARHKALTILCFVQFKGVPEDAMPRTYLATPREVADRLKASRRGKGAITLYEKHRWSANAVGGGSKDEIPLHWCYSLARVESLLSEI